MKTRKILTVLVLILAWAVGPAGAEPMGTAFTYQGHLYDANHVANGLYDFQFKLWSDPCRIEPLFKIGNDVNVPDVDVIDGYFTVELDGFVGIPDLAFDGDALWLEIGVRPGEFNDPCEYSVLSPRQKITPSPYAFYALRSDYANNAGALDGYDYTEFAWSSHTHSGSEITSGTVDEGYIDTEITRDTELNSGLATKADISHNHDGSDIVSGTVAAAHIDPAMATDSELSAGLATKSDIGHNHDPSYVNVTGDTMTGNLILDNSDISVSVGNITISGGNLTTTTTGSYGIQGISSDSSGKGLSGEASGDTAYGVYGKGTATGDKNYGGYFEAAGKFGRGVYGEATNDEDYTNYGGYFKADGRYGRGVYGEAVGVYGWGVYGRANGDYGRGVSGWNSGGSHGIGVYGEANTAEARGVQGYASATTSSTNYGGYFVAAGDEGRGVYGRASHEGAFENYGGYFEAAGSDGRGVYGEASGLEGIGVYGVASNANDFTNYGGYFIADGNYGYGGYFEASGEYGVGVFAQGGSDGYAADFQGNVIIRERSSGDVVIELGEGLDYAEGFDVSDKNKITAGSVLVIDSDNPGKLTISDKPYDSSVAGIVAGAKALGSGVRLGGGQFDYDVALAGRVYCNVDASYGKVSPGDLLTSSPTPGYAMTVKDFSKAQGAVIGKAMESLPSGQKGQILVLVTLQ